MKIEDIINPIYPLPPKSRSKLQSCIKEIGYPKGHLLMRANRIEKNLFFIKQGIVRAFAATDGHERNFWFGKEGDTVISMRNYLENAPGYEDIELLEPGSFYQIEAQQLRGLFTQDIHIANWGRCFAERELLKTEQRLISQLCFSATERYRQLLSDQPDLLRRVQLGHIASYLGITQVSLSRIRAEIR